MIAKYRIRLLATISGLFAFHTASMCSIPDRLDFLVFAILGKFINYKIIN